MRQFLQLRFWLTFAALAGLAGLLVVVFRQSSPPAGIAAVTPKAVATHRVDVVALVASAQAGPGFSIAGGVTTADLALVLDANRTMVVRAGTPGEVSCTALTQPEGCAVAATLLGDAVLWFSIVPGTQGASLSLPAVVSLPETGWAELANRWLIRRASVVERSCPTDTSSLTDFVRTFGRSATAVFNLDTQKITRVVCPEGGVIPTDSVPDFTLVPPVTGPAGTDLGTQEGDTAP